MSAHGHLGRVLEPEVREAAAEVLGEAQLEGGERQRRGRRGAVVVVVQVQADRAGERRHPHLQHLRVVQHNECNDKIACRNASSR